MIVAHRLRGSAGHRLLVLSLVICVFLPVFKDTRSTATELPSGSAPPPVEFSHFPDRLHAYVWRNWSLVPIERMASAIDARPKDLIAIAKGMGLPDQPKITPDQVRRSYITVIRRNWHLLPYEQLLKLLGWTPDRLAYTLQEDDALYIKLGSLKPKCDPLMFRPSDAAARKREDQIASVLREEFPNGFGEGTDPLFGFVSRLSAPVEKSEPSAPSIFSPRFCYSYFALYGDPLLDTEADPFPDGYLARLEQSGVDGVWLQGVLSKLAPSPWDEGSDGQAENRLANLRTLVARAREHGIGVYLYLNEPRSMPLSVFAKHPGIKGVTEGDYATLCTSAPEVQGYLVDAVATVARAVPDLAGFFTITASENLTNCWSHGKGAECPRCSKRSPAEVIAEVNTLFQNGIVKGGSKARLIVWDWGWSNDWAKEAIEGLPKEAIFQSVSEWDLPIERGGIASRVGEYSISAIGPGPRAKRHWEFARRHGMKTTAKIQAGATWELSAVPYIPAVENVARHIEALRKEHLDGLMLGWTLGGYPSPNLEVVAEMGRATGGALPSSDEAMAAVARRRFGSAAAAHVVEAWKEFSAAFGEFPYHIGTVYSAPLQVGPANLLWEKPTGFGATMVGIPYDDLNAWRSIYPPEIFAGQLEKVANGFDAALKKLDERLLGVKESIDSKAREAIEEEIDVARVCAIHFRSVADQTRFVLARDGIAKAVKPEEAESFLKTLEALLKSEITLAKQLYTIQSRDSRIGFEATNHYFYVPDDLLEKIVNCSDLLHRWVPEQRGRFGLPLIPASTP